MALSAVNREASSEPGWRGLAAVLGVQVLPAICPDKLPGGYAALGFIYEPERDSAHGVSRRRRLGVDQVGLNCAVCHTGTVRETPTSAAQIVLGMPAHQLTYSACSRASSVAHWMSA